MKTIAPNTAASTTVTVALELELEALDEVVGGGLFLVTTCNAPSYVVTDPSTWMIDLDDPSTWR